MQNLTPPTITDINITEINSEFTTYNFWDINTQQLSDLSEISIPNNLTFTQQKQHILNHLLWEFNQI